MALEALSTEDKKRLKEILEKGVAMKQEIADLNEALKDAVKTIAEEVNVKPRDLMKAISVAFKGDMEDEKEKVDTVEEILHVTGRL